MEINEFLSMLVKIIVFVLILSGIYIGFKKMGIVS
jgi:hypothetical protein